MERSGRREVISTRENTCPARSSNVGSVRGKSIMVPRMGASRGLQIGRMVARRHATASGAVPIAAIHCKLLQGDRLPGSAQILPADAVFLIAKPVNFRDHALDR